ncbi:MAG: tol-pal system YbgF family protein [Gammaproteobacteria bacterium]
MNVARTYQRLQRCLPALLAALACTVAGAAEERKIVRDLEYGHALFHFYQEDYFESAARLLAAQEQSRVENHVDDADLLLGGIYLSYGQQRDANAIFERLLDDRVESKVRDRAWLYAAQLAYQRGSADDALAALGRIQDKLEPEFEARKRLLSAQILVENDQYESAAANLTKWRAPPGWRSYVRYNLGVALLRNGEVKRGTDLLSRAASGASVEQTGRTWLRPWRWFSRGDDEEYNEGSALRDKVYLALGFAHLKEGEAEKALPLLDKVGTGMWSSKASLGQGWAAVELEQYDVALTAWDTLTGGDPLDPAVQESRLGIPFAHAKLGDENRALAGYRDAIAVFGDEITRLDALSTKLVDDRFLETLLENDDGREVGWFWSLDEVPNDERGRYLFALMADHEFQEGLKNYRDLTAMRANLEKWQVGIEAFDVMLETRVARFADQDENLARNDSNSRLAQLSARVGDVAKRLTELGQRRIPQALATPAEEKSLARMARVEKTLAKVPDDPRYDAARAKLALLRGTLLWRLSHEYEGRLWEQRKALKSISAQLGTARDRSVTLGIAQMQAPRRFDGFDERIAASRPRIASLSQRVDASLLAHERYLKDIAIARFGAHADRLRAYLTEAQFALASTYDRMSYVEAEQ